MKNLIREIHRRSLWQVLSIYLVGGWVTLGVVGTLTDALRLPDWSTRLALFLLIVGLPIVLATAFVQEGTSEPTQVQSQDDSEARALHVRHLFTWRNAALGGVAALLSLLVIAGLYVVVGNRGSTLRTTDTTIPGVAVLPFTVSAPDMSEMREGIVDVIAINLEGLSDVRPISPMTILARWDEGGRDSEVDLETATEVARSTGARYAVTGSLVGTRDKIRVVGTVLDLVHDRTLGQAQVQGSVEDLLDLLDRFSVELVRLLGAAKSDELARIDLQHATTASPVALRHYLEGMRHYRRGDFTKAAPAFDLAIAEDSTFALALYRLAGTLSSWPVGAVRGGEHTGLLLRAKQHETSDRLKLAIRTNLGIVAARGIPVAGITTEELLETTDELWGAVRRNPSDSEMWNLLGEHYWHLGHTGLLDADWLESAEEAFERAVELVPDFVPYMQHLRHLAFWRSDTLRARELIGVQQRAAPRSRVDSMNQLIYQAAFSNLTPKETDAVLDSLEALNALGVALYHLRHPTMWSFQEALRERAPPEWYDCTRTHQSLSAGRLQWYMDESARAPDPIAHQCLLYLHVFGLPVGVEKLDSVLAANPNSIFDALHETEHGRWGAMERLLDRYRNAMEEAVASDDSLNARTMQDLTTFYEGYTMWKRDGLPHEAISSMQNLAPWLLRSPLRRVLLAGVYKDAGRPRDAIRQLASLRHGVIQWTFPLYEMGSLYEELGDLDQARSAYSDFIVRWEEADPQLRPWVDTARAALIRLGPVDR